jgi:hypothetical protein
MSWADKVKATALAVLAERTATGASSADDTPWSWHPRGVWLMRARQPGESTTRSSRNEPSNPPHQQGTALRD